MPSRYNGNAKEQAEESERYEAVTAGCGEGGFLTHFYHTPHFTKQRIPRMF